MPYESHSKITKFILQLYPCMIDKLNRDIREDMLLFHSTNTHCVLTLPSTALGTG